MPTQNCQPFVYQYDGAFWLDRFKGTALLADEMGLGKTLQVYLWIFNHPEVRLTVVVCPAYLKRHWANEARTHFNMPAEILRGRKPTRKTFKGGTVYIINYDILPWWLDVLTDAAPDCLVMDECHLLGNPDTKRFKAVRALSTVCTYRIGISGTPFVNRPGEIWSICNIIRPDLYRSRFAFGMRYCQPRKERGKWNYNGAVRLDELHKELKHNLMIRRLFHEVGHQLPKMTDIVVPIDLPNMAVYNKAEQDFGKFIRTYDPKKAKRNTKIHVWTKMGYLLRLAMSLKLPIVFEWIDDFLKETNEKLLAYGTHKKVLSALTEHYDGISIKVNGETPAEKRQDLFDLFNDRKNHYRLLFGNYKAAGAGWSCKATRYEMFFEFPWAPGHLDQCKKRLHGVGRGTGDPVKIYYLVATNTIEEDMLEILQKKRRHQDIVLDGGKVLSTIDLFDQLVAKLKRRLI